MRVIRNLMLSAFAVVAAWACLASPQPASAQEYDGRGNVVVADSPYQTVDHRRYYRRDVYRPYRYGYGNPRQTYGYQNYHPPYPHYDYHYTPYRGYHGHYHGYGGYDSHHGHHHDHHDHGGGVYFRFGF